MYIYTHICEKLFSETWIIHMALTLQAYFFNGAYRVSEKSSSYIIRQSVERQMWELKNISGWSSISYAGIFK